MAEREPVMGNIRRHLGQTGEQLGGLNRGQVSNQGERTQLNIEERGETFKRKVPRGSYETTKSTGQEMKRQAHLQVGVRSREVISYRWTSLS